MGAAAVQKLFYHECGLKGLSGLSNDMRDLEASSDPHAVFALDYFVYRVGLYAGMLAAALGGLDAFSLLRGSAKTQRQSAPASPKSSPGWAPQMDPLKRSAPSISSRKAASLSTSCRLTKS